MVTIQSPFCGYNTMYYVEVDGEDLTYQRSVFKRYAQWQILIRVFTYKMAAKIDWHIYGTK